MSYADYAFYTDEYFGSKITDSALFPALAFKASKAVDLITYNRAPVAAEDESDPETITAIKLATCAIAEEIYKNDNDQGNAGIASESVGSHSVTYVQSNDSKSNRLTRYRKVAQEYLGLTGLMYLGFFSGEYGGTLEDEN